MPYTITANAGDSSHIRFLLVKLDLLDAGRAAATEYYTNADITLVTTGAEGTAPAATWVPKPDMRFAGASTKQGMQPTGTMSVGNADNTLSSILFMVGYANSVGCGVHVWEAWFDPSTTTAIPSDTIQIFEGKIGSLNIATVDGGDTATLNLIPAINMRSKVMPRRMFAATCQLDFKGAACQYAGGDTTCKRTLTDCTSKSNQSNFGGFPMLPAVTV